MNRKARRLPSSWWLAAGAALLGSGATGCKDDPKPPPLPPGDLDGRPGPSCIPEDTSRGVDSAWEIPTASLTAGTPVSDTLCPLYDSDFWRFSVSGERQLVEVELTYNRTGSIQLALDWLGPRGLCVPNAPAGCATSADCGNGGYCDLPRGGCRSASAPVCYGPAHCPGESCVSAEAEPLRSPVIEGASSATLHRIATILPAFRGGTHYLRVYDRAATVEDAQTVYNLSVRPRQDPDLNEPNDAPHLAKPLASDAPITGTFSYLDDVDFFLVTPGTTGITVVYVDLAYPDGMPAVPTFRLHQSGQVFAPTDPAHIVVGGRQLSVAWVLQSNEPILVEVSNTTGALAPNDSYTLTVHVIEDADEPTRDDRLTTARAVALGATGGSQAITQHLIAENDADWYAVTKTGADQSLLEIQLAADLATPADAPFVLQVQAYYPNATACTDSGACNEDLLSGKPEVCLLDLLGAGQGRCAVWFQRPAIELPVGAPTECAAEFGGCPSQRNNLHTQIPLPPAGGQPLLLLVRHNENTPLVKAGYSETVTYTLRLNHHAELDDGDRSNPDSMLVPRPLVGRYGVGKDSFYRRARELGLAGGDTSYSSGSTTGLSHARLTSAAVVETAGCSPLDFAVFNASGASASATVDFASASATIYSDACTTPAASVAINGSGRIYVATAAAAGTSIQLTATVGAVTIPFNLAVYTGTAPPAILLSSTEAPSGSLQAVGPLVTATLPAAASVNLNAQRLAGTAGIACHAVPTGPTTEACPNMVGLTGGCTIDGSTDDCLLPLVNSATYGLHIVPTAMALAVVEVSATGYAPAVWVHAPLGLASFDYTNSSNAGYGFISYEGDADFFRLAVPTLGKGHMTATLNYQGPVNVRVGVTRTDSDAGWCSEDYGCGISVEGSSCGSDCVQPEPITACNYVFYPGDQLNVWVNDINHDDFDRLNAYRFWFTYDEGCPASCSQFVCNQ